MNDQILSRVPLFAALPPEELQNLANCLRPVEVAPETVLFREGEYGNRFYVVLAGEVEVIMSAGSEDERLIGVRGPGEFVGELSLLNRDGRRTATVRTVGAAQLLEMSRADFDALLHRQPLMAYEMVRVLSDRLTVSHTAAIRDLHEKNRILAQAYDELKAAQTQIIEKEKYERELQLARQIQMSLLPREAPPLPGYSLGVQALPARLVGGDMYEFIPLGDSLAVLIGDVSDKGAPAAIFMARAHALLRAEAMRGGSPADVLRRVNGHLLSINETGQFVTMLYGVLDRASGEFHYARAAHELPLTCDPLGTVQEAPRMPGQPLGVFEEPHLDEQMVCIPRGSCLLLFTDGVTDAAAPDGSRFDPARLRQHFARLVGRPGQDICNELLLAVTAFQGEAAQEDDITLVAIQAE